MALNFVKIVTVLFFGFWLSACAQTSTTKPPLTHTEEKKAPSSTEGPASSESTATEPQASLKKSERSDASSAAATEPREMQTRPPAAVESQAPQTQPKSDSRKSASQPAAIDSPESRLNRARENLRLSEQTEKQIAADLEQLKKSGRGSAATIRDYENYLDSVRAMTAENRRIVAQMEAAYADKSPRRPGTEASAANKMQRPANPDIPEKHVVDEVAALDRELDASLAKFDDMLLKEMEKIQAASAGKLQELAQAAAEAARRLGETGFSANTSEAESAAGAEKGLEEETASGREKESVEKKTGTGSVSRDSSRKGGAGPSDTGQRRKEYEDDDIVARQLREAAEKETDPELKAKLWKEYEEYKKSR